MPDPRIPTHLITGATGAGKTALVSRLLTQRPLGEHWAVLVNDFGSGTLARDDPTVTVRDVAGCICCSAQVSLRTGIVALLRQRPARLLIEASAAAHPDSIVRILREPGIASAILLERTVCIVDPAQALDERYAASELYREQVKSADLVLLGKCDMTRAEERDAARRVLTSFGAGAVEDAGNDRRAPKLTS